MSKRLLIELPEDFSLTVQRADYFVKHHSGALVADIEFQFEKFKAYHEAKGSQMRNWDAAWRTWCMNAKQYGFRPTPDVGSVMLSKSNEHLLQRIAQLKELEDEEIRGRRIAGDDQRALAGTVNGRFDAQDVGRSVGTNPAQRGQGISAPAATNGHGAAISIRGLPRGV